jgi:hypothetical protein
VNVKPLNYGLSDTDLVYADDQVLNQYVPFKKIHPFRDDEVKEHVMNNGVGESELGFFEEEETERGEELKIE